jgi:hypothetical protein
MPTYRNSVPRQIVYMPGPPGTSAEGQSAKRSGGKVSSDASAARSVGEGSDLEALLSMFPIIRGSDCRIAPGRVGAALARTPDSSILALRKLRSSCCIDRSRVAVDERDSFRARSRYTEAAESA